MTILFLFFYLTHSVNIYFFFREYMIGE